MFRTIVSFWRSRNTQNHNLIERLLFFMDSLPENSTHQDWYSNDFKAKYIDINRKVNNDVETFIMASGLDISDPRNYGHMIAILRNSFTMEEFLSIVLRDP